MAKVIGESERFYTAGQASLFNAIRNNVFGIDYIRIGVISSVKKDGLRCDVTLLTLDGNKKDEVKNVEIVRFGTANTIIQIVPNVGDLVLLLAPKFALPTLMKNAKPKNQLSGTTKYGRGGMKAILLQPNAIDENAATYMKIDAGKVTLTINDKTEITCNGDVKIDAKSNAEIAVGGDAKIDGKGKMEVTASEVKVSAQGKCEVTASGGAKIAGAAGTVEIS